MICLVGLVHNHSSVLQKSLSSWMPYISCFVFSDAGSTDDTPYDIYDICNGITGYVCYDPTKSRSLLLEEAERYFPHHYYLFIHPTDELQCGESLLPFLSAHPHPCYQLLIKNDQYYYLEDRVTTDELRYKYRVHERFDTNVKPIIIPTCFVQENRSLDDKKDMNSVRMDCLEHKSIDCFFQYAMILYHHNEYVNAKKYFILCSRIPNNNPIHESYLFQSQLHLIMMDELHGVDTMIVAKSFHDLFLRYPYRAEALFYESLCYQRLGDHGKAIATLEIASRIPFPIHHSLVSYELYEKHIPYTLLRYYFVLDKTLCMNTFTRLYKEVIRPIASFDFVIESYFRYVSSPLDFIDGHVECVSYHPLGYYHSYGEATLQAYISLVSTHSITDLLVYDRLDRIPYFPTIQRIHIVLEEMNSTDTIEVFPNVTSIVYTDELKKDTFQLPPMYQSKLISFTEWSKKVLHSE